MFGNYTSNFPVRIYPFVDFFIHIGRLSKDDIEKMVRDAEKYKEEDDKQRDRLQAKNSLESYAFNMKSTLDDDKLKDKISSDDRQKALDKCNEVIRWIDGNQVRVSLPVCVAC